MSDDYYGMGFRYGYLHGRGAEQNAEQDRLFLLQAKPAPNPPELLAPTSCRVLRAFSVRGARVEIGEIVTLTRFDAESLKAIGKVEIIK